MRLDRRKIDAAFAQLEKDRIFHGVVALAALLRAAPVFGLGVLQVKLDDAVAERAGQFHRIDARHGDVPGIQDEPDVLRIGRRR